MQTVGIIVEYNPLHNGHVYHFKQAKLKAEADAVVAVMSGHFLQRGEPAIVNKWARADMAMHMGADLVIELPVAFSAQPAEWFAFGAVSALHKTGIVDSLCFGSESGDITMLNKLAEQLHHEPSAFQQTLAKMLKSGQSYPAAYSAAVNHFMNNGLEQFTHLDLTQPNNNLGLHYLIALKRLNSHIKPLTITRQKATYHQQDITDFHVASATALRKILFEKSELTAIAPYVPKCTLCILEKEWAEGRAPMHWDRFVAQLVHQLLNLTPSQLAAIYEVSEGLENRIKHVLTQLDFHNVTFGSLLDLLKTKRYTYTKLQRMMLRIVLNHAKTELTKQRLSAGAPYIRVLGFSDKGRALLRKMKKTASVPVITNVKELSKLSEAAQLFMAMDVRATSIYSFAYPQTSGNQVFRDYYEPPLYFSGKLSK